MPSRRISVIVLLSLGVVGSIFVLFRSTTGLHSFSLAPQYEYPGYDVVLAFGDSITQLGYDADERGWVTQLATYYERQMDVLNRGFSGYNTSRAREYVDQVFPHTNVVQKTGPPIWPAREVNAPGGVRTLQLCIIFFGANDAAKPSIWAHNPLSSYMDNLRYFAELLRNPHSPHYSPDARLLFITPPALSDAMVSKSSIFLLDGVPQWDSNRTREYARAAIQVAKELDAPYIDLNLAVEKAVAKHREQVGDVGQYSGYDKYLIDGLHLNGAGNNLLYRLIVKKIKKVWPEIAPETLPVHAKPPST